MRTYIVGSLWTGTLLAIVLILSSALWLGLGALGDRAGAQGAKGVALVALMGSIVNFIALVVLLARAQLLSSQPTEDVESE